MQQYGKYQIGLAKREKEEHGNIPALHFFAFMLCHVRVPSDLLAKHCKVNKIHTGYYHHSHFSRVFSV